MGTKMAPPYANIFMCRQNINKQLLLSGSLKPSSCFMFIDALGMKCIHDTETGRISCEYKRDRDHRI